MITSSFLFENFTSKDNLSTFDDDACLELINVNDSLISIEKKLNAIDEFKLIYDGLSDIQKYGEDNDITNNFIDILSEKLGSYSIGFEGLKEFLRTMWNRFIEFLKSVMKNIGEFFSNIFNANNKNKEKMDKAKREFEESMSKKRKQKNSAEKEKKDDKKETESEKKDDKKETESEKKDKFIREDLSKLTSRNLYNLGIYGSIKKCFENLLNLNQTVIKDQVFVKTVNLIKKFVDKIEKIDSSDDIIKEIKKLETDQFSLNMKLSSALSGEVLRYDSPNLPKSVKNKTSSKDSLFISSPVLPGNDSFYLLANSDGDFSTYKYFIGEFNENNKAGITEFKLFELNDIYDLQLLSYKIINDVKLAEKLKKDINSSVSELTRKMDSSINKISTSLGNENQSEVSKNLMNLLKYATNALVQPSGAILKFNVVRSTLLVNLLSRMLKIYSDSELS